MKRYIDEKGTFEIKVPISWRYSLKHNKVHTFQEYEIWKSDAFQLSINEHSDDESVNQYQNWIEKFPSVKINDIRYFIFPENNVGGLSTKSWTTLVGKKTILFTLTHSVNQDFELDPIQIDNKIEIVHEIISTFKLISQDKSEDEINSFRFEMFLQGVGATVYMLNKAVENQAFIEATCLLASQIDGILRTGIVLQKQLNENNSKIDTEWIYQGTNDRKKSEKDIYQKAKELGILNDELFKELYVLYDDRNRVIHRFIISEITVAEVEEIAYKYYEMQQKIKSIIYDIESKQIELGVGMTKVGDASDGNIIDEIKGKFGKQSYFEDKK